MNDLSLPDNEESSALTGVRTTNAVAAARERILRSDKSFIGIGVDVLKWFATGSMTGGMTPCDTGDAVIVGGCAQSSDDVAAETAPTTRNAAVLRESRYLESPIPVNSPPQVGQSLGWLAMGAFGIDKLFLGFAHIGLVARTLFIRGKVRRTVREWRRAFFFQEQ